MADTLFLDPKIGLDLECDHEELRRRGATDKDIEYYVKLKEEDNDYFESLSIRESRDYLRRLLSIVTSIKRGHLEGDPLPDQDQRLRLYKDHPSYGRLHNRTLSDFQYQETSPESECLRIQLMKMACSDEQTSKKVTKEWFGSLEPKEQLLLFDTIVSGDRIFPLTYKKICEICFVNQWTDYKRDMVINTYRVGGRARYARLYTDTEHQVMQATKDIAKRAWCAGVEDKAQRKLKAMATLDEYEEYMLTGDITVIGKQTKLMYVIRRLRPTLIYRNRDNELQTTRCLGALCMHPVGYYDGTWAGVLCPTDDVMAHLLMIKTDEKEFWNKSVFHNTSDAMGAFPFPPPANSPLVRVCHGLA